MNDLKFRKRTDEESRQRMEARRSAKEELRAKLRGRMFWHSPSQGTYNVGRNKAKRERRAVVKANRLAEVKARASMP